mmetsp:Transcript_93023/g.266732  ORF Transcript_93023/g.266732 Transcript_93023/m.266732 type:complete len:295 (-) Transcript_93023:1365-2249(-)
MEGPAGVDAWLELKSLIFKRPTHGLVVGPGATLLLRSVLDAVYPKDPRPVPLLRRVQQISRRLARHFLEGHKDLLELLAGLAHLEQLLLVPALMARRSPQPAQALRRVAQPPLGRYSAVAQPVAPRPNHVHLRPFRAEHGIEQARNAIPQHQRLHVVSVTFPRELARINLAAVRGVIQEARVRRPCRHQALQLVAGRRGHLVVGAMRQHNRHALRQVLAHRVRVDHQRRATPAARLPKAHRVHPALGGDSDNVGAEPVDLCLDVAEVRPNWKVRLLRVRDVQDPVHLEACLLDR